MTHDDGFRAFQRRIGATPLLTAAQERELAQRIERGDDQARRRLVEANLRLVVHLARRLHHPQSRLSLMDLVQEGSLGLMRAAERFDHRRGVRFATYASWWINEALYKAIDERARIIRLPLSVRDGVKRLREVERALGADLQRSPTSAELAEALGVDAAELAWLRAAALAPASLDAGTDEADGSLAERLVDEHPVDPDAEFVRAELEEHVSDLVGRLNPTERRVIEQRYGLGGHELASLRDAAKALGTTPAKVRLVEELALRRLRALAEADRRVSDGAARV